MKKTHSMGRDTVNMTAAKVVTALTSLVSYALLSRYCTTEEYGTYAQLLMVINLATAIVMLGLPNSMNYFLARAETQAERQRFLSFYYTLSTLLSAVAGLALVLAAPLIVRFCKDNVAIYSFVYFLAVFPWASIIDSGVENMLVVYHRTQALIVYRTLNFIALTLVILVVWGLGLSFQTYMALFLGIKVVFALCVYVLAYGLSGGLRPLLDRQLTKMVLAFSLPLGLSAMVGTLNIELDKLLISHYLGTSTTGIYNNASKELPVTMIATAFTAVLLPRLARLLKQGKQESSAALWGKTVLLSYAVIAFLAAGFFVYAEEVMTLLYGGKYLPGVGVFRVFCLVLLLRCTYFGMMLNASGKTKFIFYSSLGALALNIGLNLLLFFPLGMIGPAIASLASQAVIDFFQLAATSRVTGVPLRHMFPWVRLLKVTLLNGALATVFWLVKRFVPLADGLDALLAGFAPLSGWFAARPAIGSIAVAIVCGCVWGAIYFLLLRKRLLRWWRELNQAEA